MRNQSQQPVSGAAVRFSSGSGQQYTFTTGTDGRYCARGLAPGSYIVTVTRLFLVMSTPPNGVPLTVTVTNATAPAVLDLAMHIATQTTTGLHDPTIGAPGNGATPPVAHDHAAAGIPPPPPVMLPPTALPPAAQQVATTEAAKPQAPMPEAAKPEDIGEAEAAWFNQLKTGAIQYNVPTQMTLGDPAAVSVSIYGYQAPVPAASSAPTSPLKVSNFMRVTLSQDDNPDEFTVVHGDNADEQFVPVNGSVTWKWTVTPKHLGKNLKLQLQAFVLYSDPKQGIQQSFPAASRQVTVVAQGVKGIFSDARDSFWSDPQVWIKYMLPGGAGFAALAAIIGWWIKRKKPAKDGARE